MNIQFITPTPYSVRRKLRQESSKVKNLWIPAPRPRGAKFTPAEAGAEMTFLPVACTFRIGIFNLKS